MLWFKKGILATLVRNNSNYNRIFSIVDVEKSFKIGSIGNGGINIPGHLLTKTSLKRINSLNLLNY